MISIENISAGYGSQLVLSDVSMHAEAGEFIGIIGPNGSGKTTMLRTISGVLALKSGKVMFDGTSLKKINRQKLAQTMACLSQELSLNLSFTVRQIVLMGRFPHVRKFGGETQKDFEIADKAMEFADVSHLGERLITEISGGEKQRALIAMCLAQEPKILLLDEPTNHLDISHQLGTLDLIKNLNHQRDMTVISVFHDLNLASEYCDKLLVLDGGKVAAFGEVENVLTSEMILKVYGAKVRTEQNPVSGKPHVILSAAMNNPGTDTAGD